MTMGCLSIQTPVGLVEGGDTVTVDLSRDPVARNYEWPKRVSGRVVSAHSDHLNVALEGLRVPGHLGTQPDSFLPPPMGFMYLLGADNASQVVKVVKR